jgi:hypothetical protein
MFPEHLWIEHAILISVCRFPSDSIGVFFIFLEQGRATGMDGLCCCGNKTWTINVLIFQFNPLGLLQKNECSSRIQNVLP